VPNAAVVDKKSSAAARQAAHQRFGSSDVDYHRYWGGELSVIIKWQTDSNYDVSLTYYRSRFYTAMSSFFDVYVTNPAANGCASLHK
jgi:hypothetical protein